MQMDPSRHEMVKMIQQELNVSTSFSSYEEWLSALANCINNLVLHDFNKLIFILYRLDVNEAKLMSLLQEHPGMEAGQMIGELIIKRQLQKIATREAYKQDNTGIDENEKW